MDDYQTETGDTFLTCRDCSQPFVFSARERDYFQQHDLQQPKRCQPCRKANTERRRS